MTPLLQIVGLSVSFGSHTVLRNISFDLDAGSLTTLIGPNGAGKSTVFAALSGDLKADHGSVLLRQRDVQSYKANELALERAVLPQDYLVRFSYSVEEIVGLARLSHPPDHEADARIIDASLRVAEVSDMRERDVQTLSGGEMARTAFARVLAQATPLVLLDEPTAALDLRHQESVLKHARRLRDEGACVVVVLHDLNLAAAYSDRVILLADGRIQADGTPEKVLTAERITGVYGQHVIVTQHPTRGCPLILATE